MKLCIFWYVLTFLEDNVISSIHIICKPPSDADCMENSDDIILATCRQHTLRICVERSK